MYLDIKDLEIIQIDDGEQHFIVAKNEADAKECFFKELNFENLQECDLQVWKISKDEDIQINLSSDDDLLLQLINRYRNIKDRVETINIWDLLKFIILENTLQERELELPFIVSSSTFC